MTNSQGITLIELLVAMVVLVALSAIALPAYNGYVQTSREGALLNNIATIEVFQEDFRLRNGAYQPGVYSAGAPDANLTVLGWRPQDNDGTTYTITVAGGTYDVTAARQGTTVCRRFPAKIPCP